MYYKCDSFFNEERSGEFIGSENYSGKVGVGFDTKGSGLIGIKSPSDEVGTYLIPDTREGWVMSLRYVLNAFFKEEILPEFNYSEIREAGKEIKTFGGISSGPSPLIKLINDVTILLRKNIGKDITSRIIVDIMNMIGVCVVSGNVRRTAQIAIGESDDIDFMLLKDYNENNVERAAYGWTSNNSIFCNEGMDYSFPSLMSAYNGEPGYIWIDNIKEYSRMNGLKDNKDRLAAGTNPCGEQSLESYEMCCLVETFPSKCKSIDDFKRTLKFAYLYAKTVTLGNSHWAETNRVMLRNRRIGTSISGIAQFVSDNNINTLKTWMEEGYSTLTKYDEIYSNWLCIPKSIKLSSIKPSGSTSLLAGVTPGIHYPESKFYIRRIRLSKNSDLIEELNRCNYKIEDDVSNKDSTVVVEIPIRCDVSRTINDVSMWEQLELAAFAQKYWADNQVSCTITFKNHEKYDIEKALNYFQYRLKSISFLPKTEKGQYAQMPYEEISEAKYIELEQNLTKLEFSKCNEDSKPELYCDSSFCQLI